MQPTRQLVRRVASFQFLFAPELTRTHKAHRETQSGVVVWQLKNRVSVEATDYLSGWLDPCVSVYKQAAKQCQQLMASAKLAIVCISSHGEVK